MIKIVFALAMLAVVTVRTNPLQSPPISKNSEAVSLIQLEEPCVRQGGICLRIEDCSPDNLVQVRDLLCPMQMHLGVECCYT